MNLKELYVSVTEETSNRVIHFAENYTLTYQENIQIMNSADNFFIIYESWEKKKNNKSIEVTLGNYYGAELCQLIGIYIQSLSENILQKDQMILQ